jgi:hypothetical protein
VLALAEEVIWINAGERIINEAGYDQFGARGVSRS